MKMSLTRAGTAKLSANDLAFASNQHLCTFVILGCIVRIKYHLQLFVDNFTHNNVFPVFDSLTLYFVSIIYIHNFLFIFC